MKRYLLTFTVAALMLVLAASAVGFAMTLQTLHLNAISFIPSLAAPVSAAPMTYADESRIGQPESGAVRFETYEMPRRVCEKSRAPESRAGF